MESKIKFEKDEYISSNSIESILRQLDTFHRFILINSQTVVGNPIRSYSRRASKVIDGGQGNRLILNISLQKKINKNLEITYILKSSNGVAVVGFQQEYTAYEEIYKDLVYVADIIRELYTEVKSEIEVNYTDETKVTVNEDEVVEEEIVDDVTEETVVDESKSTEVEEKETVEDVVEDSVDEEDIDTEE